jgi:signal transduction histidine kinase
MPEGERKRGQELGPGDRPEVGHAGRSDRPEVGPLGRCAPKAPDPVFAALDFFGRILAGQTHELTNVLNIIHELTGLQGDLLAAGALTPPPDVNKLQQITGRIRQQLQRGDELVRSLNRFAHSVDRPVMNFDLREALEQVAALAQRAARLAKVSLDQDYPARSMSLETSLFRFQHAVFMGIELALAAASRQRRIVVGYRLRDAGAEVTVVSGDPLPTGPAATETRALLGQLVHELGGQVAAESAGDMSHCITLFFPGPGPEAPHAT